jgi:ribosomal protein S18 acetylase RimI-like enzyme
MSTITKKEVIDKLRLRAGRRNDCNVLADLINQSAQGAIDYLLSKREALKSPVEIMSEMLARELYYSYENAIVAEYQGQVIGAALNFPSDGLMINEQMKAYYSPQQLQYIRYFADNKIDNSWHLDALCVHADYRGLNVGQILLDAVKKDALDFGFTRVGVYVFGSNVRAIEFYKRNGFELLATIDTTGHEFLQDKKCLSLLQYPFAK